MAKRSRKVSTKRSKRPRRSKSSSRKTMKRTKRQPSRKRTSRKPKKVIKRKSKGSRKLAKKRKPAKSKSSKKSKTKTKTHKTIMKGGAQVTRTRLENMILYKETPELEKNEYCLLHAPDGMLENIFSQDGNIFINLRSPPTEVIRRDIHPSVDKKILDKTILDKTKLLLSQVKFRQVSNDIRNHYILFICDTDHSNIIKRAYYIARVVIGDSPLEVVKFDIDEIQSDFETKQSLFDSITALMKSKNYNNNVSGIIHKTNDTVEEDAAAEANLKKQTYYTESVDTSGAKKLLTTEKIGTFIVRESSSQPDNNVLSFNYGNGKIIHFLLNKKDSTDSKTGFKIWMYEQDNSFDSVTELIDHYITSSPTYNGETIKLIPYNKDKSCKIKESKMIESEKKKFKVENDYEVSMQKLGNLFAPGSYCVRISSSDADKFTLDLIVPECKIKNYRFSLIVEDCKVKYLSKEGGKGDSLQNFVNKMFQSLNLIEQNKKNIKTYRKLTSYKINKECAIQTIEVLKKLDKNQIGLVKTDHMGYCIVYEKALIPITINIINSNVSITIGANVYEGTTIDLLIKNLMDNLKDISPRKVLYPKTPPPEEEENQYTTTGALKAIMAQTGTCSEPNCTRTGASYNADEDRYICDYCRGPV